MSPSLEHELIYHCAPTLASLKPACMCSYRFDAKGHFFSQMEACRRGLALKGVEITALRVRERTALVYVYRREKLAAALDADGVGEFLSARGYVPDDTERALAQLRRRVTESETIPHEIGLFLGYPLCDVAGFIEHRGRDSKYTGFWQVYGDVNAAVSEFEKYRRISDHYRRLWERGKSVYWLTVAS